MLTPNDIVYRRATANSYLLHPHDMHPLSNKNGQNKTQFYSCVPRCEESWGGETRPVLSSLSTPDGRCSSDLHSCSLILKEIVACVQATAD